MASAASISHASSFLQLSSSFLGDSLSSPTLFIGPPLKNFSPSTLSGKQRHFVQKNLVIISKRISGLEEAMRIKRERELRTTTRFRRRPPLRRGKVSPRLPVPDHIPKPPYLNTTLLPELSSEHQIHDAEGIPHMKAACELAARVLDYAGTLIRPSVTTDEIDKAVHKMIIDAGAYPSPLGYGGFPKSVCTSVNECMCHGIPDSRQLQDGDIINIDVTVFLNILEAENGSAAEVSAAKTSLSQAVGDRLESENNSSSNIIRASHSLQGYHGDTSKTFLCGNVDDATKRLVKVTEECLERAISVCKDGANFMNIGKTISEHAENFEYNVVEQFVGHGIGTIFHSEPIILHYRNEKPGCMVEGQTFTIEPILTAGSIEYKTWSDNWTTLTADGSPAAQFEHTILITRTGAEILTKF